MLGSISQEPWCNDTSIHFGHFGVGCFLLDQQVRRQRFDSGCQKGDFLPILQMTLAQWTARSLNARGLAFDSSRWQA